MTKRELCVELTTDQIQRPILAREVLRAAVSEWAANRTREGRPLELMLFVRIPAAAGEAADAVVDSLFDAPDIHQLLQGKVVSVSIRSDDPAMPVRGGSFILE